MSIQFVIVSQVERTFSVREEESAGKGLRTLGFLA